MTETQKIQWRSIGIEAAAIVASILLAFAIDAWWEERSLRIEEQQVLRGLREEFLNVRSVLTEHRNVNTQDLQSLQDFLSVAADTTVAELGPIVDAVVLILLRPMTSDLGSGTLAALLSSGRIEILTNRSLRSKLASWEGVIGEVWDDQALNVKSVYEIYIPYFLAQNIPAGAAMHQWYDEWPLPRKSPSDDPDMISRLIRDETLRGMVEIRYGYQMHTVVEFDAAIEAVDSILDQLESSIR